MKTYVKPELIDLTGMEAFGECSGNGSGDTEGCNGNGNNADTGLDPAGCSGAGNMAYGFCAAMGNAAANGTII